MESTNAKTGQWSLKAWGALAGTLFIMMGCANGGGSRPIEKSAVATPVEEARPDEPSDSSPGPTPEARAQWLVTQNIETRRRGAEVAALFHQLVAPQGKPAFPVERPSPDPSIEKLSGLIASLQTDVAQLKSRELACRQVSASAVNSASVQCRADEQLVACITTNLPAGNSTCFPYGDHANRKGGSCYAACGGGVIWGVTGVCCKI